MHGAEGHFNRLHCFHGFARLHPVPMEKILQLD